MSDHTDPLARIRRPRLLVRAARIALDHYVRDRDLGRLFGPGATPRGCEVMDLLLDREAHAEETRRSGGAGYSVARHVSLLTALMAERRLAARVS
jgi:hypothetical protein